LIAAFFLGLLPYLHLPLASGRTPIVSWGDQRTCAGFKWYFIRQNYGTFSLGSNSVHERGNTLGRHGLYLKDIGRQMLFVGVFHQRDYSANQSPKEAEGGAFGVGEPGRPEAANTFGIRLVASLLVLGYFVIPDTLG
jgi:hypothetical protein